MVSVSFVFLAAFGIVTGVLAAPVELIQKRQSAQAAPHWVAYSDKWVSGENGPPAPSVINGFNVFILSFLMTSGAADQALEWTTLDSATRASIKSEYANAGMKLLVSAFGSTDAPTSEGYNPTSLANTMAAWVKEYDLDGIDVDYEDFNAFNSGTNEAVTWLVTFTQALRAALPAGQYIITHARWEPGSLGSCIAVAPWFSKSQYPAGSYLDVNTQAGGDIDWYNIQFYNQGSTEYTTCAGLLTASSSSWPNTALFQINASGVSLNKLVIGKPANSGDASTGYMSTSTLASCVQQAQAQAQGWEAGVMTWEYPDAASAWIEAVRADSWPV
ncbi:glycoside hydrolase [Dacryopinax primogenitus]|uniref:Glycoside hydrolase n=1 Tax=Dacryopinax primogenitus (strain DJM 731) TaxID=1858805 RepID=M5G8D3_DACPD|nr:glycoside hydrolase [Dacryopinax primogenitus]EJU05019.1 glycoside hydrolase [Dacryopinax primogenitus]